MSRAVMIAAILMLACVPAARAQITAPVSRSQVVWTSAAVGAAVGGIDARVKRRAGSPHHRTLVQAAVVDWRR